MQKRDKHAPHLAQCSLPSSSDQSPDCSFSSASVYLVDCPTQPAVQPTPRFHVNCQKNKGQGNLSTWLRRLAARVGHILPRARSLCCRGPGLCVVVRALRLAVRLLRAAVNLGKWRCLEQASSSDFPSFIISANSPKGHIWSKLSGK